ncbi:hypothetical protein CHI95_19445 [Providencia rettgeri]|uniref:Uncharacterized protein n=1 Tax=Providencia rettgeri TaxID=587 RepID=A0A264VPU5_PRORE|nr:hypothetical protein [Providencia rettgeri]OZS72857.1 hypothetical protein CHI95_19445 [Providencia rettgeri]
MTFLERLENHKAFLASVSLIIATLIGATTFEVVNRPAVFMLTAMPAVIASVLVPSRMGPGLFLLMPCVVQVSTAGIVWCFTSQGWTDSLGIGALLIVAYVVMTPQNQDDNYVISKSGQGISRLSVDPFSMLLYSTAPDDVAEIRKRKAQ